MRLRLGRGPAPGRQSGYLDDPYLGAERQRDDVADSDRLGTALDPAAVETDVPGIDPRLGERARPGQAQIPQQLVEAHGA